MVYAKLCREQKWTWTNKYGIMLNHNNYIWTLQIIMTYTWIHMDSHGFMLDSSDYKWTLQH
jgi:hypothetical protein